MKPNGSKWRHGRARLDLSVEDAAAQLRIRPQYLRNIESNQERATPSERLVYRAERLYGIAFSDLVDSDNEGVPDEPPDQAPQGPTKPPKRAEKAGGRPKRPSGDAMRGVA